MSAREKVTAACPDLARLIDTCKERFAARLVYVKVNGYEAGNLGAFAEPGCKWTPYEAPKVKRGNKG